MHSAADPTVLPETPKSNSQNTSTKLHLKESPNNGPKPLLWTRMLLRRRKDTQEHLKGCARRSQENHRRIWIRPQEMPHQERKRIESLWIQDSHQQEQDARDPKEDPRSPS